MGLHDLCSRTEHCSGGQIKENGVVGTNDTHGEEEVHTAFWFGYLKERKNLEYLDLDGRIILKCILRKWQERLWILFLRFRKMCSVVML